MADTSVSCLCTSTFLSWAESWYEERENTFRSGEPTVWKAEPFKGELTPFFKNKHSFSCQTRRRCASLKCVQLKSSSVNKLSSFNWQNFILELIIFVAVGSAVAITQGLFPYFTTNPHHRSPGIRDLQIHRFREANQLQICPNSRRLLISLAKWNSEFLRQLQRTDRVGYSA